MGSMTVSGDLKTLLFVFLGIMVAILVLGYHKSPQTSAQLGAQQLARRNPNVSTNVFNANVNSSTIAPVSTEQYVEQEKY